MLGTRNIFYWRQRLSADTAALTRDVADTLSFSDVPDYFAHFNIVQEDNYTLSDAALTSLAEVLNEITATAADSIELSDAIATLYNFLQAVSDFNELSDAQTSQFDFFQAVADSNTLSDALAALFNHLQELADSNQLSDSLAAQYAYLLSLVDSNELTDGVATSISTGADYNVTASDAISLSDAVLTNLIFIAYPYMLWLYDALSLSDAARRTLGYSFTGTPTEDLPAHPGGNNTRVNGCLGDIAGGTVIECAAVFIEIPPGDVQDALL